MRSHLRLFVLFATIVMVAAACGSEGSGGSGGGTDSAAGGGGPTLSIESPADGAEVDSPFELQLSSSEAIGPPESGDFHYHVWYDGNEDKYAVVDSDTYEVATLPPGEHTIVVSLRNADHSAAGAETEITVRVAGAAGGSGDKKDDKGDSNYGY